MIINSASNADITPFGIVFNWSSNDLLIWRSKFWVFMYWASRSDWQINPYTILSLVLLRNSFRENIIALQNTSESVSSFQLQLSLTFTSIFVYQ